MERKIKFRGKDIETDKWVYGNLIHRIGYMPMIMVNYESNGKITYGEAYAVKRDTIGQLTGICDKNGREIYEGDIVKSTFTTYIVTWDKECACFSLKEDNTPHLLADYIDDIEVFGNIYDNPELLNK